MYSLFGYKPVNTTNLIKQYIRTNRNTPSASQEARDSILKTMLFNNESKGNIEPLSHSIMHNGKERRPITGVAKINQGSYGAFPSAHVSYIASSPRKSQLSRQTAVMDLGDNLYDKLGDTGVFDLTANTHATNNLYKKYLNTDAIGQGTGMGLKRVIRKRQRNN
jgi:hypothetical protein